jgi:RimJ/RimL family protein N-acetyltransferase
VLVRYGFEELGFSEVWASTDAPNAASARVLEKAGLRFERRAVVNGLATLFYCLPRPAFSRMAPGSGHATPTGTA